MEWWEGEAVGQGSEVYIMEEIKESSATAESEFIADQIELSETTKPENLPKTRRTVSVVAVTGIFLLGVIGFLYFAKVFFLPLVLAAFPASPQFVHWPVYSFRHRTEGISLKMKELRRLIAIGTPLVCTARMKMNV